MSKNFDIVIEASKLKEKVLSCVPNNQVNQTNYKTSREYTEINAVFKNIWSSYKIHDKNFSFV